MSFEGETQSRSDTGPARGRVVLAAFWGERSASFELPRDGSVTLGRGEACELRVDHPSMSRAHARFHSGDLAQVEDLGSRNGTRIHGVPLAPGYRIPVSPGDILECGDVMLLLREVRAGSSRSGGEDADVRASRLGAELVLGTDGLWFELGTAGRVRLGRHGALRRVLVRLAEERLSRPGVGVNVDDVIRAGWPEEVMLYEAGLQRAYTTIRRLRALGLERALLTRDEGYLLDPCLSLRFDAS